LFTSTISDPISATYKKNGSSELSGFYHSIFGFLASYRVSKYKIPWEITDKIINQRKGTAIKKKPSNIIKRAGRFEVKTEHF
jgi:hypothetical protein